MGLRFSCAPPASQEQSNMCPMNSLVSMDLVDKHKLWTPIRSHPDPKQAPVPRSGQPLIKHLRGCEENVRRFCKHPLPRKSDFVRLNPLSASVPGALDLFPFTLDVALQPCHALSAPRAPDERAFIGGLS